MKILADHTPTTVSVVRVTSDASEDATSDLLDSLRWSLLDRGLAIGANYYREVKDGNSYVMIVEYPEAFSAELLSRKVKWEVERFCVKMNWFEYQYEPPVQLTAPPVRPI